MFAAAIATASKTSKTVAHRYMGYLPPFLLKLTRSAYYGEQHSLVLVLYQLVALQASREQVLLVDTTIHGLESPRGGKYVSGHSLSLSHK